MLFEVGDKFVDYLGREVELYLIRGENDYLLKRSVVKGLQYQSYSKEMMSTHLKRRFRHFLACFLINIEWYVTLS
jgi:hypothetical protein